ncbi:hypothetical protein [Faecalimicrobium dakarense]|uniref:hypothetical protein n=1 Tax=Faecalimicrobium dakarense TaxID=1301100 RepID=UPI0004B58636|nr:hypothetical protein [[Clostridium] dakarense]
MEIKIDINLNLQNINQVIEKLSYLINKNNNLEIKDTNIHTNEIELNRTEIIKNECITIEDIREKISKLSQMGKVSKAKEILSKYNASKVSQLNINDYESINKELNYELSN